ncbi:hypothetical protein TNCV_412681 [Trichonephila clavipes]|nr:hypothetical protein TNCV_412681 [Trichonephila clavipes]
MRYWILGTEITVIKKDLVPGISVEGASTIYLKGIFGPAVKCPLVCSSGLLWWPGTFTRTIIIKTLTVAIIVCSVCGFFCGFVNFLFLVSDMVKNQPQGANFTLGGRRIAACTWQQVERETI